MSNFLLEKIRDYLRKDKITVRFVNTKVLPQK